MEFIFANGKSIYAIERQIAQLAEQFGKREDGKFPSNIIVNQIHNQRPRKEHQFNVICFLRNGKRVDNKVSSSSNLHVNDESNVEIIFYAN